MIRIINQNYTKEAAKHVLRSAVVTIKNHLMYHCTNMIPSIGVLELKNETTKPTDILEGKRNIQVL